MTADSHDNQASNQAKRYPQMRRRTSWRKGQSGNPSGTVSKARTERQQARKAELRAAVASEFTGELNTLERVLVDQAADALEYAERAGDNSRVRLVRLALQLMGKVRSGRKEREAAKPAVNPFDAYISSMGSTGK